MQMILPVDAAVKTFTWNMYVFDWYTMIKSLCMKNYGDKESQILFTGGILGYL